MFSKHINVILKNKNVFIYLKGKMLKKLQEEKRQKLQVILQLNRYGVNLIDTQ